MWLLDARTLKLVEFDDRELPEYAILSHTWGKGEVSFQDFQDKTSLQREYKKGYAKVRQCCKQAREAGLGYAWVDTCCIDKKSSAELSEAINSMFRWYQRAAICYAYLSDVYEDSSNTKQAFQKSRWFKRGWTLQELLAPRQVQFYSANWIYLGDRERWKACIADTTGIHEHALLGKVELIRQYSIAQKMSWAVDRVTTRVEDIAYCLLGIFGVNMPLLYGEGENAFIRLQEEIMKSSDDQSLFAWQEDLSASVSLLSVPETGNLGAMMVQANFAHHPDQDLQRRPTSSLMSLLASSPSSFKGCSGLVSYRDWTFSTPYSMTNAGLRISGLVCRLNSSSDPELGDYMLFLRCYDRNTKEVVGVPLRQLFPGGDQYARGSQAILKYGGNQLDYQPKEKTLKTIFIRKEIIIPNPQHLERARSSEASSNPSHPEIVTESRPYENGTSASYESGNPPSYERSNFSWPEVTDQALLSEPVPTNQYLTYAPVESNQSFEVPGLAQLSISPTNDDQETIVTRASMPNSVERRNGQRSAPSGRRRR